MLAKPVLRVQFARWARTGVADFPYDGPSEARVVDLETGAEVPAQIVLA
jgi:hypothetical protein